MTLWPALQAIAYILLLFGGISSVLGRPDSGASAWSRLTGHRPPAEAPKAGRPSSAWVEVLSWEPRAFHSHNFLSREECDHIMRTAKPQMRRSTVVGPDGQSVTDQIRTSHGTFLSRRSDPTLLRIEQRLAAWTHLPLENQEDLQVLRYSRGEKYGAHYDSLQDGASPRVATVLLYLNNASALVGGETAFPKAPAPPSARHQDGKLSECAQGIVAIKPSQGDALLFYTLDPFGEQDPLSMHTGCPVIEGVKWTATKWIHTGAFHPEWLERAEEERAAGVRAMRPLPDDCENFSNGWECESNRNIMIGDDFNLGQCRRSCAACEVCAGGDQACRDRNRARSGYLVTPEGSD